MGKLEKYAKELESDVKTEEAKKGHINYIFKNPENHEKLLDRKAEEILALCREHIPQEWQNEEHYLRRCILTIDEKILQDPRTAKEFLEFYFTEKSYEKELLTHEKMKVDPGLAKKALTSAKEVLEKLDDFSETKLKEKLLELIERLQVENGQVLWPLRAALTGEQFSPGAFEVASALGKEKSIQRIEKALALIG